MTSYGPSGDRRRSTLADLSPTESRPSSRSPPSACESDTRDAVALGHGRRRNLWPSRAGPRWPKRRGLKRTFRRAELETGSARLDLHRTAFLRGCRTISPPPTIQPPRPPRRRDLPLPAGAGKGNDVELQPARLIRRVTRSTGCPARSSRLVSSNSVARNEYGFRSLRRAKRSDVGLRLPSGLEITSTVRKRRRRTSRPARGRHYPRAEERLLGPGAVGRLRRR